MKVNFAANTICIDRKTFNLDDVRKFLLDNHPSFCIAFQISSHKKGDSVIYTYDWGKLFRTFGIKERITLKMLRENGYSPTKKHK